jgi:hypothetical protein
MSKDPHAKRHELQRLVDISLELARDALARQESLLPGFIAVQANGKIHLGASAQGGSEGYNLVIAGLWQKAAEQHLRAAALYRDVRVRRRGASEDVDAIQVVAELASGESLNAFQVYRTSPLPQTRATSIPMRPRGASAIHRGTSTCWPTEHPPRLGHPPPLDARPSSGGRRSAALLARAARAGVYLRRASRGPPRGEPIG